jgi:hypothetical protein
MLRSLRVVSLVVVAGVVMTACSEQSSITAPGSANFAKSGTTQSGGGSGGGNTTPTDTATAAPTTSPTGEPIAPTYTGKITTMGVVPAGFYYGSPSGWEVNGWAFASGFLTSYKPANGPIVLGACVTVSFNGTGADRFMTEMKTVSASKCP